MKTSALNLHNDNDVDELVASAKESVRRVVEMRQPGELSLAQALKDSYLIALHVLHVWLPKLREADRPEAMNIIFPVVAKSVVDALKKQGDINLNKAEAELEAEMAAFQEWVKREFGGGALAEESEATPTPDEAYCMQAFLSWLRDKQPHSQTVWEYIPVPEQDKKPDFFLTLDGAKYAVEHTNFTRMESVQGQMMNYKTALEAWDNLIKMVRLEAIQEDILDGSYNVIVQRPTPNFAAISNKLKRAILDFVRATPGQAAAPFTVITVKGQEIGIEKHDGASVLPGVNLVGPPFVRIGDERLREACKVLNEAVTVKRSKLEQKGINIPAILLLFDELSFATPETWLQCVPQVAAISYFHTVFLVSGQDRFILYSRESSWQPNTGS